MKNPVVGMTSHIWLRDTNIVYSTSPVMCDWTCAKCGEKTTANIPPTAPCPERIKRLENQRYM